MSGFNYYSKFKNKKFIINILFCQFCIGLLNIQKEHFQKIKKDVKYYFYLFPSLQIL